MYQIFKIIYKQIQMYASKIGNRITFRINSGYILKLLISKTMKLLGKKYK